MVGCSTLAFSTLAFFGCHAEIAEAAEVLVLGVSVWCGGWIRLCGRDNGFAFAHLIGAQSRDGSLSETHPPHFCVKGDHLLQWRGQVKYSRGSDKLVNSVEPPFAGVFVGAVVLVSRQEEWRQCRTGGGLYLQKTLFAAWGIRENVATSAIAIGCDPTNSSGNVGATDFGQSTALDLKHQHLTSAAECTVSMVPSDWIEFLHQTLKALWQGLQRISFRWSYEDFCGARRRRLRKRPCVKNFGVPSEVPFNRVEDCVLVVLLWLVARDPGHAKFIEDCRDVLVFKLDRSLRSAKPGHPLAPMAGFDIGAAFKVIGEHREVAGDNRVKLVISPLRSALRLVNQSECCRGDLVQLSSEPFVLFVRSGTNVRAARYHLWASIPLTGSDYKRRVRRRRLARAADNRHRHGGRELPPTQISCGSFIHFPAPISLALDRPRDYRVLRQLPDCSLRRVSRGSF